jgi:predicted RNA-binding protein with RPS1 domain
MNADRFACALEAATLIPMILMQKSLLGGLLMWNPNWDATTRWEVKKRQNGLRAGCVDDLDLCMKVFSGWEGAGKDNESREAWARSFMVNHEMLSNYIFPERSALLDHLSIATKGEGLRSIDFDLLDRVRIVFAYSFPDQIGQSDQFSIASESVCYGQELQTIAFARRIPFRSSIEGQPDFRVSLVIRLDPGWGNLGQLTPIKLGQLVSQVTRDERGEGLFRSSIWEQVGILEAPIGSKFLCRTSNEDHGNAILIRQLQSPREVYQRPTGIFIYEEESDEELEIEGASRSQGQGKRYINYEAPEEELDAEPLMIETPKLRILSFPPPAEWKTVDIYIDEELEIQALPIEKQSTAYFDISSGDHTVMVLPSGQSPQIKRQMTVDLQRMQDNDQYSILLGPWQGLDLRRIRNLEDVFQVSNPQSSQIRWSVGGKLEKVDVFLNHSFLRIGAYKVVDFNRPSYLEVYSRGGRDKKESPLLVEKITPNAGDSFTIIIYTDMDSNDVKAEVIHETDVVVRSPALVSRLDSIYTELPKWFSLPPNIKTFDAIVHKYIFIPGKSIGVRVVPAFEKGSLFENFKTQFTRKSKVDCSPIAVETYPERRRAALIVEDQKTHNEIAVDGEELFFCDHPSEAAINRLMDLDCLSLLVDDLDFAHERVYLTRLPILDASLSTLLGEERKIPSTGIVSEVVLDGPRPGIGLLFPLDGVPGISVFMHSDRVAQGSQKPITEFHVGDIVRVQLNFIGGKVKVAGWSEEIQELVSKNMPSEIRVYQEEGEFIFAIDKPMRFADLEKLIQLHPSRAFKEAARALYRQSNLPQVDLLDAQRLARIDQLYSPGVIIEGCVVNRILSESVEIKIEPNVLGGVHISEWATERINDLSQVAKVGENTDAVVFRREDNGFLRLSRRRAIVWQLQENARYFGEVITIDNNGAEIKLLTSENGQALHYPVVGYVPKNLIKFPERDEIIDPNRELRIGQKVLTRVINLDQDRGRITLTIWKAYEVVLIAPDSHGWGWVFTNKFTNINNLERQTGTKIFIEKEKVDRNKPGKITVDGTTASNVLSVVNILKSRLYGTQEQRPAALPAQPPRVRANPTGLSVTSGIPSKKPFDTSRKPITPKPESEGCLAGLWKWIKDLLGI